MCRNCAYALPFVRRLIRLEEYLQKNDAGHARRLHGFFQSTYSSATNLIEALAQSPARTHLTKGFCSYQTLLRSHAFLGEPAIAFLGSIMP